MPILAFQKPDKVVMLEANSFFGKFEFKPLEPGYGKTVGNALPRTALLLRDFRQRQIAVEIEVGNFPLRIGEKSVVDIKKKKKMQIFH